MRRDHRPYYLKRIDQWFQYWYAKRFLRPQFASLGLGAVFMKPWHVEVFGAPVCLGDYAHVIATADKKVRFTVWSKWGQEGKIDIGKYCLICPGVRISAARDITIGDSCMLAQGVLITDADWHGVYDRSLPIGQSEPVNIGRNVWLGDGSFIGKGVTIGENSIIGTGSVVVKDVPPNVIAAGNPAQVVRLLNTDKAFKTRAEWLAHPQDLTAQFMEIDRELLKKNTLMGWLRAIFNPRKGD